MQNDNAVDLETGKFVVVSFESKLYPGLITEKTDDGYTIQAMAKSQGNWKWPNKSDEIDYSQDEIVLHINEPQKLENRGVFKVSELAFMMD